MNGGGGGAYNKHAVKRKPSSLVLSRTAAAFNGRVAGAIVAGTSARRNDHGVNVGSARAPRGGQLKLQSVSRAPPTVAAPGSSNSVHEQHKGQQPPPRNSNGNTSGVQAQNSGRGSNPYQNQNRGLRGGTHGGGQQWYTHDQNGRVSSAGGHPNGPREAVRGQRFVGSHRRSAPGEPPGQAACRQETVPSRGDRSQAQAASQERGPRPADGRGDGGGAQQNGGAQQMPRQQQRQPISQPQVHPPNRAASASIDRGSHSLPPRQVNSVEGKVAGNGLLPVPSLIAHGKFQHKPKAAAVAPPPGASNAPGEGGVVDFSVAAADAPTSRRIGVPAHQPSPAILAVAAPAAPAAAAAIASEGDAVLRARLAEVEARNTEMEARVKELEENNFDLEASMQMIEVEASHRVDNEAKALQSKLKFKGHQLALAQSNHTAAVRELDAERGKRKKDHEKADRERKNAAVAAASAAAREAASRETAASAVAAAAAAVATAEAEAKAKAALTEENRKATVAATRRRSAESTGDGKISSLPTLAELVISESSDDVMVLLNAASRAGLYALGGGDGASSGSDGDGASGGGGSGSSVWMQTPLGTWRQGRDGDNRGASRHHSLSSTIAPSSVSPVGTRARLAGGGSGGGATSGGGVNREDIRHSEGTREAARKEDFSDALPRSLAFTPVQPAARDRRPRTGESAWRPGSGRAAGEPFAGKSPNGTGATLSPRCFWSSGRGVDEVDIRAGGSSHGGCKLDELRGLSSQMFACVTALVEGEACAGDLLDALLGFLETLSGDTEGELEIIVSAVRLVYRVLAVIPSAAGAVASGWAQEEPLRMKRDGAIKRAAGVGRAATSAAPQNIGLGEEALLSASVPSKGKKRRRCGSVDESSKCTRSGGGGGGGDGGRQDGPSNGRRAALLGTCSLFIAGEPVSMEDVLPAPASVLSSSSRKAAVTEVKRGSGSRGREDWAGRRGAHDLGRRIKDRLVALFHAGVLRGCAALVVACLQAILTTLWDRESADLAAWGCLLDAGSFQEVMFSELYRSAWELGAQVLRVLTRNVALFRRLAADGQQESSSSEVVVGVVGDIEGGIASSKSVMTDVTALPTPPPRSVRSFRDGADVAGCGHEEDGDDDYFLGRLCLEAVTVGEHAPFGTNVGLRLSVIRLVFFACQRYGAEVARSLFRHDGGRGECRVGGAEGGRDRGGGGGGSSTAGGGRGAGAGRDAGGSDLIPALVNFVRLELEDWERRRYSHVSLSGGANPIASDRVKLLKEAFQLLWALAMHTPLPLRDMAQGAGVFNTMVSVVSRFYNSVEMEEFEVHKEAMMLMEKMN